MKFTLPGCKGCEGLRKDPDGTVWLTKPNPAIEKVLDRMMIRMRVRELRWVPIPEDQKIIKPIENYRDAHEGMIGLVLGKGPSLSRFLQEAPKQKWHVVAIGINEAAMLYPCKYVFALDDKPLDALGQAGLNSVFCLQPRSLFRVFHQVAAWEWGKHATPGYETAPIALEVMAGVMGIRRFVMVGFDGYDSPYDTYAAELRLPPRNGDGYAAVNNHIDEVAKKYGLDLVWWHRAGAERLEGQNRLARRPNATTETTLSATRS